MFNFIFEGKIGEILAPVVPSNQLFLAIQHHRNQEIQNLMSNNSYDVNEKLLLLEGGYGAIHVACRYNNKFALELILSKGISLDFSDQNGNSPLHYAAKYGNIDICKVLVERGASILRKNKQQQSAYDSAEGYDTVRQYLLPILLQAERNIQENDSNSTLLASNSILNPYYQTQAPSVQLAPVPTFNAYSHPVHSAPTTDGLVVPPPFAPPITNNFNRVTNVNPSRVIQPDGFHSSASDPELQAKYGHTKEVTNVAPPPTSIAYQPPPAGPPPVYAPGGASSIYNRYVPYDAHTNASAPIPNYNPPVINQQQNIPPTVTPSLFLPVPSANKFPSENSVPSTPFSNQTPPSITKVLGSPSTSNSLLGHKTLPSAEEFLGSATTVERPKPQPLVSVFNPSTDQGIITANSTSNSIL